MSDTKSFQILSAEIQIKVTTILLRVLFIQTLIKRQVQISIGIWYTHH